METAAVKIDIKEAKAYLREKEKIRRQKHRVELEQNIKIIRDLARIWEKYNIKRVYLYGSIARLKTHNQSDIDIALEGDIDFQQLLSLYGEVDKHFSREIDIRILDELPFKETIKEKESQPMKGKLTILKSEILRDMEKLDRLLEKFAASYKKYHRQKDYAFLVESAFYMNQIYTGFERMFHNVAETFENSIDEKSWHKSLLDRMLLDLEGIRPSVISKTSYRCLNELRAFRHFFRHTYDFDLEDEKFSIVASRARELEKNYRTDIEKFLQYIDDLINS